MAKKTKMVHAINIVIEFEIPANLSEDEEYEYIQNVLVDMQENCGHFSSPQIHTGFDMEIIEGEIN